MMSQTLTHLIFVCAVLAVIQLAAALPWLLAVEPRLRAVSKKAGAWAVALAACFGIGVAAGAYLHANADPRNLAQWGRLYASILHLQLAADFFVAVLLLYLLIWPKSGAVALSAFRESLRQPMYWLLTGGALLLLVTSPFWPYFTFGEDLKMVKELGYAFTMLSAAAFAVLAAGMSISEEIEGRTAVTLMSKPVSRRQFLLGKFGGILLAALVMTVLLGWVLVWIILFKEWWDPQIGVEETPDPAWVSDAARGLLGNSVGADLVRGMNLWINDAGLALPGLTIGFCQVMVLLAIAVALATRFPMIVNVVCCLVVYFLGHLTPIMTEVSRNKFALIYFVAQLFETLLPGLDLFDVGTAIVREVPLPTLDFAMYTFNVTLYAVLYTGIALLFGLILFEDRDLA